jgi:hypothetical protein
LSSLRNERQLSEAERFWTISGRRNRVTVEIDPILTVSFLLPRLRGRIQEGASRNRDVCQFHTYP